MRGRRSQSESRLSASSAPTLVGSLAIMLVENARQLHVSNRAAFLFNVFILFFVSANSRRLQEVPLTTGNNSAEPFERG